MDRKHWQRVIRDLSWLSQFGFSVALSPVLFLLGAHWLVQNIGFGAWVYLPALILGLGTSASSFYSFLKHIKNRNGKS